MEKLSAILFELEHELIDQEVTSSADRLNTLLADDFIEYGSSGVIFDKKTVIDSLTNEPSSSYEIYDFEVIFLSDDFAQTRFKTDRTDTAGSKLTSLRSSVWKKRGDMWQMFFHQGTPIKTS